MTKSTNPSIIQSTTQAMSDDEDKPALNSYTFVIPEPVKEGWNWYNQLIDWPHLKLFETGQSLTFSGSCNPDLEFYFRGYNYSCESAKSAHFVDFCSFPVRDLIGWASYNTNGHLETWLQCPQCGCGAEDAANLNDLYAAEQAGSRKVSDVELLINDTITNYV